MATRDDEQVRRDQAQALRGDVVEGSGLPIEPSSLEQMVSVRLEAEFVAHLRELADNRQISLSALIREALGAYAASEPFATRARWKVTGYDGIALSGSTTWDERMMSRSALRQLSDHLESA